VVAEIHYLQLPTPIGMKDFLLAMAAIIWIVFRTIIKQSFIQE
jgi:hypothetical protein